MAYKTRPFAAVANAKAWVEKERSDKVAKACKETEVDAGNVTTADLAKENEAEKAKALTAEKENGEETGSENLKETS
jgi:hypothetical protein